MQKKPKIKKKEYEIAQRRRPAWDIACVEAEEAFSLPRTERRTKFTLSYSPVKVAGSEGGEGASGNSSSGGAASKKAKRKLSISGGGDPTDVKSPPKKKQKRTTSLSQSPTSKDSEKLANQPLTQFMVYCSKKKDAVRREHPTYTDAQIEKVLQGQWDALNEEQKSKFIPMGQDVKDVSQMLVEDSTQQEQGGYCSLTVVD